MNNTTRQIIMRIGRYAVIQFPRPGWRAQASAAPGNYLRLGRYGDERGERLVRRLGRTELVGTEQVGHDPQHPFHERAGAHADPGELAHHGRVPDRLHERASDLEVEAVQLLEPLRVALEGEAVAGREREVERVGRQAPGLVRVRDALAVERVDGGPGVADDEPRRPDARP